MRTLYVGWSDGGFLAASRTDEGYRTQWIVPGSGIEVVTDYDARGEMLGETEVPSDYDPRERPWCRTALRSSTHGWSDPYLDYGKHETLVSPASTVHRDGDLTGVVAADLEMEGLRAILDDLPYGAGAEAFVLSPAQEVIAAPSEYTERLEDIAASTGRVPTVDDLDMRVDGGALAAGEARASRDGEMLQLDQALPAKEALDLDEFKDLNDELGHHAGDAVLTATGEALLECVRGDDVAARLGGDEFVVLQRLSPLDDPQLIVERVRDNVHRRLEWLPIEDSLVGVTAGYALSRPEMSLAELVALADAALVDGKRSAKGTVHRA